MAGAQSFVRMHQKSLSYQTPDLLGDLDTVPSPNDPCTLAVQLMGAKGPEALNYLGKGQGGEGKERKGKQDDHVG